MNEKVLVFPENIVKKFKNKKIIKDKLKIKEILNDIYNNKETHFIDRNKAENDIHWKQIIPYNIVWQNDKIFSYKRTKKGGEKRLFELRSIGIGGHVSEKDKLTNQDTVCDIIENGLERELVEEVGLSTDFMATNQALLYDNSNDVGLVHCGIINYITLGPKAELSFKDYSLSQGGFESVPTLKTNVESFESWSKLIIDNML